jgi:probable HAF family extracellular repeat protein
MKHQFLTVLPRHNSVGVIILVVLTLIAARQGIGQTRQYVVTELSNNDRAGVPCKLNNFGDIAGRGASKGVSRATVWERSNFRSKGLSVLMNGDYSSAFDINDVGDVAGVSNTGSAIIPIVWTAKGGLTRIPLLPGDNGGQATAINKFGNVVGYSSGGAGAKAFVWRRNIGLRNLGTLPGGHYSTARDINDSEEAVGTSDSSNGERAVLWTKEGSILDLGTLPGDWVSEASAINNSSEVVGYSKGARGTRAFVWNSTSGMQEIGVLPGGNSSRAADINDRGEVVGISTSTSGEHAFIWTKQSGIADLNSVDSASLGFVFIEAHAVNTRGQIIVMGTSVDEAAMNNAMSSEHSQVCAPAPPASFLLTPAPLTRQP